MDLIDGFIYLRINGKFRKVVQEVNIEESSN